MKKTLVVLALLSAFGASAQTTSSGASSGANSGSSSGISATNSGNASANGNTNSAGAQSGSMSGASSGAMGNSMTVNQNVPSTQTINSTSNGTQNVNSTGTSTYSGYTEVGGGTNNTSNDKYDGTLRTISSGGTVNTTNENVHYSGTQTIKNVPGIAMSGPASGPCTGNSGGIGVAGPGFGVGLNGAKVDDGCTVRENTRILGQLYQSLDAANPARAEAQAALLEGMSIIRNMNARIGSGYAPATEPKRAEATPTSAPVAATPTPQANTLAVAPGEPSDPYVRARMGLK